MRSETVMHLIDEKRLIGVVSYVFSYSHEELDISTPKRDFEGVLTARTTRPILYALYAPVLKQNTSYTTKRMTLTGLIPRQGFKFIIA